MFLFYFKKVAAISLCCTVIFTGSISSVLETVSANDVPQSVVTEISNDLLEKQREIDEYVFVTHSEEIANAGFKITNTGPIGEHVEIGILPYNEANANFLYDIFGREMAKVVEGIQAVTLPLNSVKDIVNTSNEVIKIQVDGELLDVRPNPFIENDRTLIPLRGVMEKLGARVEWYEEKSTVKIIKDYMRIELVIGEDTAKIIQDKDGTVNEEIIKLEVPSKIIDDLPFIPVRFVSESLGSQVEWNQSLNTVVIKNRDKIAVERPVDFEVVEKKTLEENETISKWYQGNYKTKGIYQHIDGEWMYALVSAGEKPTGGYSLKIDSITEVTPGTAYIYAVLNSPDKDSMVTQALTYPHIVVRFSNANIEKVIWDLADAENIVKGETEESLEKMGKAISTDLIKEMKLYSLMQEEIKIFTSKEIIELVNKLNTSPTYNGPYIEMLAGNSIKMVMKNDEIIRITSFGSKEYVILSVEGEKEYKSYCIISPEIGSILLGQENETEQVVRNFVEDFGTKLQMVSLLAPKDVLEKSVQEYYGKFVTPTLLEKWMSDPINAPGRLTSSPWPDRIEIITVKKLSENEYEVKGNIVEISSPEKESGKIAAKQPITLTVKKINERWLIDDSKNIT